MSFSSRFIKAFVIIPIILFLGGVVWWSSLSRAVNPSDGSKINFNIPKGESISEISQRLKSSGLIRDPLYFKILTFSLGFSKKVQAGSFYLSPSMTPIQIVKSLSKGTNDQKLTIIEGLRQEEIGQLLAENEFDINLGTWFQTIKSQDLEGKLFPDTYFFPKRANSETILKIFDKNFSSKVANELKLNSQENLSLKQILILASIVEREARNDSDRKIVAGILMKRWQNNWPLQADATVQYAVGSQRCKIQDFNCDWWPKKLTGKDLQINSLYNTYKYKGLPPGPICNPSLSSIKTVLGPQESPYWFYLSDSRGVLHYAKTDTEQAENIQRYLK